MTDMNETGESHAACAMRSPFVPRMRASDDLLPRVSLQHRSAGPSSVLRPHLPCLASLYEWMNPDGSDGPTEIDPPPPTVANNGFC